MKRFLLIVVPFLVGLSLWLGISKLVRRHLSGVGVEVRVHREATSGEEQIIPVGMRTEFAEAYFKAAVTYGLAEYFSRCLTNGPALRTTDDLKDIGNSAWAAFTNSNDGIPRIRR